LALTGSRFPRAGAAGRAWLVLIGAFLVGLWLPLAPGAHALLDHVDAAAEVSDAGGGGIEAGHGGCEHGSSPDEPERHDEHDCSICVQLAVAKRTGLAPVAAIALAAPARVERATPVYCAPARPARLGREASPRGPPRGCAIA
jgi:hypothetical protein